MSSSQPEQDPKTKALNGYRRKLLEHRELDAKLKESKTIKKKSNVPFLTFSFFNSAPWFKKP